MSLVLFKQEGPVAWLTLNNPDNLNAMTHPMGEAIEKIVPQLNANRELRVVILRGAGRAFSAGGDLQFILDHTKKSPKENQSEMLEFYAKFLSLRNIEVPTIAMINGPAIGAGFLVALCCDLRFAAEGAKLAANFAKIGLSSGMGGLYWLTRLGGPAVAADLLFTGRTMDAAEAKAMGFINDFYKDEALEARVTDVAKTIAANAPIALKIMKRGIQKAVTAELSELLQYEAAGQAQSFGTEDLIEGVESIKAKKPPKFRGR
jgi:enoyl-CoA hydratase